MVAAQIAVGLLLLDSAEHHSGFVRGVRIVLAFIILIGAPLPDIIKLIVAAS